MAKFKLRKHKQNKEQHVNFKQSYLDEIDYIPFRKKSRYRILKYLIVCLSECNPNLLNKSNFEDNIQFL